MKPKDNNSNQQNANKSTTGVNKQYAQVQGNKGQQMNPNTKGGSSKGSTSGSKGGGKK